VIIENPRTVPVFRFVEWASAEDESGMADIDEMKERAQR
jgi:hypothetical protein